MLRESKHGALRQQAVRCEFPCLVEEVSDRIYVGLQNLTDRVRDSAKLIGPQTEDQAVGNPAATESSEAADQPGRSAIAGCQGVTAQLGPNTLPVCPGTASPIFASPWARCAGSASTLTSMRW